MNADITIGSFVKDSSNEEFLVKAILNKDSYLVVNKEGRVSTKNSLAVITIGDNFDEIHFEILFKYFNKGMMNDYFSKYKARLS